MSSCRRLFIVFVLAALPCGPADASAVVEETTEQSYWVGDNPSLTVRNTDGRIFVYGSEDYEIRVKAYKRTFTKERMEKIAVQVKQEGDAVTIDTIYAPPKEGILEDRSGTVEYTILVPQNTATKVQLSQGEIQVHGLRGTPIDLQLVRGRMSLKSCFGPMQIALGSGGIDVSYDWWEERTFLLVANLEKGDVTLNFPVTAALRIDAATQSGHIRNHLLPDGERGDDVQNLQTTLGGGSDVEFKVRTGDGNIKIGKPY